jgi:hypothetical protein
MLFIETLRAYQQLKKAGLPRYKPYYRAPFVVLGRGAFLQPEPGARFNSAPGSQAHEAATRKGCLTIRAAMHLLKPGATLREPQH